MRTGNPMADLAACDHVWQQLIDKSLDYMCIQVKCEKCGCPGEIQPDETVFWPTT